MKEGGKGKKTNLEGLGMTVAISGFWVGVITLIVGYNLFHWSSQTMWFVAIGFVVLVGIATALEGAFGEGTHPVDPRGDL